MKKPIAFIALLIGTTTYAQLESIQTSYDYDNLNRLVQVVSNEGNGFENSYSYDDLGNRLNKQNQTIPPNLTYVPDDAFEQELIDLGYDDVMDDYVLTNNINILTTINLEDLAIEDATGIEDFIALEELFLDNNELSELNVETLSNLLTLRCSSNNLTSITLPLNSSLDLLWVSANLLTNIDLSQQSQLFNFQCIDNELESLDLSGNPMLELLRCNVNNIPTLDLSQNLAIRFVDTRENELTTLQLSNNSDLYHLDFRENAVTALNLDGAISLEDFRGSGNELVFIDFQNNPLLEEVFVDNNALEGLNVQNGNNENLTLFSAVNNLELFCIQVDDENAANNSQGVYANWNVDAQVSYSEDCEFLGVEENTLNDISIIPNPTSNILTISLPKHLNSNTTFIDIYDTTGRLVISKKTYSSNSNFDISVTRLTDGVYTIVIRNDSSQWNKTFIKN